MNSFIKSCLTILLICLMIVPLMGQTIVTQNFNSDPFPSNSNINTDYPVKSFNCQNPSYIVGPNFNTNCSSLPSFTGNGRFLVIDNSSATPGAIYEHGALSIPAGNYTLSFRVRSRYERPWQTINLDVEFNGIPVHNEAFQEINDNWTNISTNFTYNGSTAAVFGLRQTTTGASRDYAIDEIVLTRTGGDCDLPPVTVTYSVEDDEYCFTADVASDPNITSMDFAWDFGDGSTATGNPACHTFTDGTYEVCVVVEASNGSVVCDRDTVCKDICVVNEEPPCECGISFLETGTDQNGCTADLSFDATLNECTSFVGASVDWGDGNITQVTTLPGFAIHTYTTPGTYFPAIIIDGTDGTNICDLKGFAEEFTCGNPRMAASGDHASEAHGLEVFPNPTSGQLTVRHSLETGSVIQVSIKDNGGREVFLQAIASFDKEFELELSDLPAGVYHLQLKDAKGKTMQQKFVVE